MASESLLGMTGEEELLQLLRSAKTKVAYMAPGISERLARAIGERWEALGPDAIRVILDVDPEVCRMGYGTIDGLELLHRTADRLGTAVRRQPGVRIGLLIADGQAVIFAPTPLLIEGGSANPSHPNSVRLGAVPLELARELGFGSNDSKRDNELIGGQSVDARVVQSTKKNLEENPPLRFDVAQRLRVFNAKFEFVEFEFRGGAINRKTVPIPAELLGLARHPEAQDLLRSTFKLVGELPEVSPKKLMKLKQSIVDEFLVTLPGFGQVVLRPLKPRFERRVRAFERYIRCFMTRLEKALEEAIEVNRQKLVQALLPGVVNSPPKEWLKFLGPDPSRIQLEELLNKNLRQIFNRSRLELRPRVRLIFKGVTYELLNDPKFLATAENAFPGVDVFHEEFDVSRGERLAPESKFENESDWLR